MSENVNLKGTSTEPQTIPLSQEYHFCDFEVPRVGTIKILEGPHSHPQRAPRTTCLRQRGHPGSPTQNFCPPLAPESRALPYHDLVVLGLENLLSNTFKLMLFLGAVGASGAWRQPIPFIWFFAVFVPLLPLPSNRSFCSFEYMLRLLFFGEDADFAS